MVKIISFEGGIGSGKTSLTNYFSYDLKIGKILEEYNLNPFLKRFYQGDKSINFETEITFLLIHYSQLKDSIKNCQDPYLIADFSIEKDLIFAELNLKEEELNIFRILYDYIINDIGVPYMVIYLNLSYNKLRQRILRRGREYEMNVDPEYFKNFNKKFEAFLKRKSNIKTWFIDVDDLQFDPNNSILKKIKVKILDEIK